MTMIIDVSGKSAPGILQTLKSEGVNATLADLLQVSDAASANELPSFWAIDNGVITGASDSRADLIPASEPEPAPAEPLTLAQPEPAALPSITPAPEDGTPVLPVDVLAEFSQEVQAVATPGIAGTTASTAATPVPADPLLGIKRTATAPSGYIPITERTTTTSTQEQDLKNYETLLQKRLEIDTELSDINLGRSQEEANAALQTISQIKKEQNKLANEREERQKLQTARENEVLAAVEAATLEYKNAEIDSGRIWQRKGTGSRILAAIAAGLGAYASAMSGTKNFALEIINNAISDDIDAQKSEIALKGGVITEQRNLLSDLIRKGMSDTEAENAARVIMLSQAQTMLQERLAKIKVGSVKQEGALLQEQLNNEREMKLETLRLSVAPKTVVTEKETQQAGPALVNLTARELAKQRALGTAEGKSEAKQTVELSDAERRALSVPGYIGVAPTVEEAKKARDASKKMTEGIEALDNLVAMRKKHGFETDWFGWLPDADREAAKTDAILFLGMIKNQLFLDLGVLQDADVKLLARAVPQDPLGVFREGPTLAQYQTIRDYMVKSGEIYFSTLGLIPEGGVRVDLKEEGLRKQLQAAFSAYKP